MNMRFLVTAAAAAVVFTSAAHAADLPRKYVKAPVPVAAPFSWTGFYVGAHGGGGWGDNAWSDFNDPINGGPVPGPNAKHKLNGALAGGQIGYNWQTGWTVFGIEADASWADIKGNANNFPDPITGPGCLQNVECSSKIEALGTITGRVGAAFDRTLLYVKGGAAWALEKHVLKTGVIDPNTFNTVDVFANTSDSRWGWTVGAGVEFAVAANWSLKAEYNYLDFGKERVNFAFAPAQAFGASGNLEQTLHVVKGGINYHF